MNLQNGVLSCIFVSFLWGIWGITESYCTKKFGLNNYLFVYYFFSTIINVPLTIFYYKLSGGLKGNISLDFKLILCTLLTIFIIKLADYFFANAYSNLSSTTVITLTSTYPLFTFILSVIFLKEQFQVKSIFGIILIIIGIILIR